MTVPWSILLCFLIIINAIICERQTDHKNLLNGIVNLFKNMSLNTVWTSTCWDTRINNELLLRLSKEDISITFNRQNAAILQQTHRVWYKSGMLVDLACDQTSNILKQASKERLFNLQNDWILFNRYENANRTSTPEIAIRTFKTHMGNFYVMPDSRVYLLIQTDNDYWEVWDGFRLSVTEEIQVSRVGEVTPNRVEIKHSDRTNFQRVVLRASTVILEPEHFHGWKTPKTHNLDVYAHMHYAVSNVLSRQLNFTLNLTFSPDYGWSYGNGTYSGLMGQLHREEIDFTAAGGLMRVDRMEVGDLTVGTFLARTAVIFRKPPLSSVNNILTLPFAFSVWIVVLMMIFMITVVLIGFTWASNHLRGEKTRLSTILDTVNMVLGAICQQGLSVALHSVPARMATFTLFLTTVFLFTSYAANIVVLIQSTSDAVKVPRDLLVKPITISAQDARHVYIFFNDSTDENIQKLYQSKLLSQRKNKAFTTPEVGIERVRNEFHSFLVEITWAYHILAKTWREDEKCSLNEIDLFKIPLLTLYVVKKSGYKDLIKQKLIQQHEVGLYNRISRTMLPKKSKCDSTKGTAKFDSVSMKEIFPALIFLGYGIFAALLLFVFEHIYKIKMTRSEKIRKINVPNRLFSTN